MVPLQFLLSFLTVFWQLLAPVNQPDNFAVSAIPEALTRDADVIVRRHDTRFVVINTGQATETVHYVYTILNKSAADDAILKIPYSNLVKINSIKGTLYDKDGKELEKLKPKNIYDLGGITNSLIDDTRIKVARLNAADYPFTVAYEYELSYAGTLFYPTWQPQENQNYSVEAATFQIMVPKGISFRHLSVNGASPPEITASGSGSVYLWKANNLQASEKQLFQPALAEITPMVFTAPNDFSVEKQSGNMSTWLNFGNWINQLNKGRSTLPETTVAQVRSLVANEPDEEAKIKKLYEYLQNKTRYVSVQLGLGGWQPFEAGYVDAKGYGDCKALTNYMQALLHAAGIKSYYTLIRAGENERDILKDFPSNQFNHALLCIPGPRDTTWLECTSQTESWGYNGHFTGNRHGLMITPEGGKIVRTAVYGPEVNLLTRKATIKLDRSGNVNATLHTVYTGLQQDIIRQVMHAGAEIQKKWLNQQISLPNASISAFNFKNTNGRIPEVTEELSLSVNNYASMSSKRLFLTPNFNNRLTVPALSKTERTLPIVLNNPFIDSDEITYLLPAGSFDAESLPEAVIVKSIFGEYQASCRLEGEKLIYTRRLKMNSGRFPATTYGQLTEFYKKVSNADKSQAVFVSKT